MKQQVHIRTYNQSYVQAENGGGGAVVCSGPWPREYETFTILPLDESATMIRHGAKVRLGTWKRNLIKLTEDGSLTAGLGFSLPRPDDRGTVSVSSPFGSSLSSHFGSYPEAREDVAFADIFTIVMAPGQGDSLQSLTRFGLLAANGKYVCAENGGGGALVANSKKLQEWETFMAEFRPVPVDLWMRINLRTADGQHFLQAKGGGGSELTATGSLAREWETFYLLAANRTSIGFPNGAQVNLRMYRDSGYYVSATNGGGGDVTVQGQAAGQFETFTIILEAGVEKLQQGDNFGLRASSGQFLTANGGGGGSITATGETMGNLETFMFTTSLVSISEPQGTQDKLAVSIREKPLPATKVENSLPKDDYPESEPDFVCMTRPVTVTESYSEALLLDPLSDVVWPGSIIDGARWVNGEYLAIPHPRAPLTVSLSIENFTGAPVSTTIQNPRLSTMRDALNTLRGGLKGVILPAKIQVEITEIHSREQLQLAMSGSFDTGVYKLAAKCDFSTKSVYQKVLLKYLQTYFTIDVDLPPGAADLFEPVRIPSPNEMIISSITYGRMLVFMIESKESMTDLKAAVQFAYQPYKVDVNVSAAYDRTLSESKKSLLVLGGDPAKAEPIMFAGGQDAISRAIEDYAKSGGIYNEGLLPVPLSYRMRFLQKGGFPIGNVCLTTTFTERRCVKSTGRVRVKDLRIGCVTKSDVGSEIELYGKIWIRGHVDNEGKNTEVSSPVASSLNELVWERDKDHYVDIAENSEVTINAEPRFTFAKFHEVKDRAYIEVEANFWEKDDTSADDPISGETKKVYINDLQPSPDGSATSEVIVPFTGDGNKVEIRFTVELL